MIFLDTKNKETIEKNSGEPAGPLSLVMGVQISFPCSKNKTSCSITE